MTQKPVNSFKRKKTGGSRYAALTILILIVIIVTGYLVTRQTGKPVVQNMRPDSSTGTPSTSVAVPGSSGKSPQSLPVLPVPESPQMYPETTTTPPADSIPQLHDSGKRSGKLAIIIDDMGASLQEARTLASIGVPLTFSIIPGLRNYKEVAAFSESNNIETMIHVPMQSKGWPQRRLEANGLLVSMDEGEIQNRVNSFINDLPKAVGINNHMGSEFTEHDMKIRAVLRVLKDNNLFFIDSATSPKSVGMQVAKELGVKSARRAVFLDNEQNETYIRGQLNQAVSIAKKQGGVIAICHPHPATLAILSKLLPTLKQQGITLIYASAVVR